MSKPKAPKESADAAAARLAEEERIRVMQARAQADEAAAGRQLLTRKTRMTMRLFGARSALAGTSSGSFTIGGANGGSGASGGGGFAAAFSGGGLGAFLGGGGDAVATEDGRFLGGRWAR